MLFLYTKQLYFKYLIFNLFFFKAENDSNVSKKNFFIYFFEILTKISTKIKLYLIYFFNKYFYTINHKRIAINYFFFSILTGLSGSALATMIRLELAEPGSKFFKGDSLRYLQVITAHGLIMIFFVVVPILFGGFANFLIPYHVGSKDVAFPRLNSIGFWIQPCGFILISKIAFIRPQFWSINDKTSFPEPMLDKSFFFINQDNSNYNSLIFFLKYFKYQFDFFWPWRKKVYIDKSYYENEFASFIPVRYWNFSNFFIFSENFFFSMLKPTKIRRKKLSISKCSERTYTTAGWTLITPLSSNPRFTNYGSQDLVIISLLLAGFSTTISFTNLLITWRTMSAPGLKNRKILIPFITISLLLTMRMLALVTPVLGAALIMLLSDRHWQTSFFEFIYGGDSVLFQHLFWFFGHPEVYILIIPTFGFVNMILPNCNHRRVASKQHLVWAIYTMAYMGFFVWGHHMYLVGLDHRSRSLYSTITIMISLPATIKLSNWTLSLLNGFFKLDIPFIFSIGYILLFLVGGFTGMWLSHVGLNIAMHDTFYVVAHFHIMLSGATMMGCFCGFYYYFSAIFLVKYSKLFAYFHFIFYFGGQWFTFLPMFWLGLAGFPRRIHDYPDIYTTWHSLATVGHFITMIGVFFFLLTILDSHIQKKLPKSKHFGIPRINKRLTYYMSKTKELSLIKK